MELPQFLRFVWFIWFIQFIGFLEKTVLFSLRCFGVCWPNSLSVAESAKAFDPKILYAYHYSKTDPSKLVDLLKATRGIEIRIREMK